MLLVVDKAKQLCRPGDAELRKALRESRKQLKHASKAQKFMHKTTSRIDETRRSKAEEYGQSRRKKHRKQEEMKKLADNQDDDYTASTWANPKSLKGHFAGVSDVRFR